MIVNQRIGPDNSGGAPYYDATFKTACQSPIKFPVGMIGSPEGLTGLELDTSSDHCAAPRMTTIRVTNSACL